MPSFGFAVDSSASSVRGASCQSFGLTVAAAVIFSLCSCLSWRRQPEAFVGFPVSHMDVCLRLVHPARSVRWSVVRANIWSATTAVRTAWRGPIRYSQALLQTTASSTTPWPPHAQPVQAHFRQDLAFLALRSYPDVHLCAPNFTIIQ